MPPQPPKVEMARPDFTTPTYTKPLFLVGVSEVTWLRSNRESTGRNSLAGMGSGVGQARGQIVKAEPVRRAHHLKQVEKITKE